MFTLSNLLTQSSSGGFLGRTSIVLYTDRQTENSSLPSLIFIFSNLVVSISLFIKTFDGNTLDIFLHLFSSTIVGTDLRASGIMVLDNGVGVVKCILRFKYDRIIG